MKDRRYANRGATFEQYLRYTNERYKNDGVAVICKIPTEILPIRNAYGTVVNAKVCTKSTVDFIGRAQNRPIAIEAKETKSDSIRFDAVQDHQADFLRLYEQEGAGISLVVVSFNLERFYAVPATFWLAGRDAWKKAQKLGKKKAEQITITYEGQTWTTTGKASVKETELLPEWKIEQGGRYGLDYLRRYIKSGTIA